MIAIAVAAAAAYTIFCLLLDATTLVTTVYLYLYLYAPQTEWFGFTVCSREQSTLGEKLRHLPRARLLASDRRANRKAN